MGLVDLQRFKEDFRMLDEACRQWYAFIQEDISRADGIGFGEFYDELCRIKYREYLQNPDDFYKFKPSFPVFLALNKEQTEALAETLDEVMCGNSQNEETLSVVYNRLDNFLHSEEGMEMKL